MTKNDPNLTEDSFGLESVPKSAEAVDDTAPNLAEPLIKSEEEIADSVVDNTPELTELVDGNDADLIDPAGEHPLTPPRTEPIVPAVIKSTTPLREPQASTQQKLWPILLALLVILLDQWTKRAVEGNIPLYSSVSPLPRLEELYPVVGEFFQFTHTQNFGAAFGILQSGGALFTVVAIVVAIIILFYNWQIPAGQLTLRTALGLQLGGAIGNLIDRLRQGYVTDFFNLNFRVFVDIEGLEHILDWPIFNIADMAIVGGVIILAILMLFESWEERQEAQASVVSNQPSVASNQSSVISFQSSVASHQSPATSHQSPATSHQPPTTSHQPPVTHEPSTD